MNIEDVVLAPNSHLTPISIFKNQRKRSTFICRCVCGKEVKAGAWELKKGRIVSCGCKRRDVLAHSSARKAQSYHNMNMRWLELEKLGARMPQLNALLKELAKEYPVYV